MAIVDIAGNNVPVGNTLVQAYNTPVIAGQPLTVFFTSGFATPNVASILDTVGTVYNLLEANSDPGNGENAAMYGGIAPSSGTNVVTVTFNSAPPDGSITIMRHSGRDSVTPYGDTDNRTFLPASNVVNDLIFNSLSAGAGDDIACWMVDTSSLRTGNFSPGSSPNVFTQSQQLDSGGLNSMAQVLENVSAGTIAPTATTANVDNILTFAVVLKAGSGPPPPDPIPGKFTANKLVVEPDFPYSKNFSKPSKGGAAPIVPDAIPRKSFISNPLLIDDYSYTNALALGAAGPGVLVIGPVNRTITNPYYEDPALLHNYPNRVGRGEIGITASRVVNRVISNLYIHDPILDTPNASWITGGQVGAVFGKPRKFITQFGMTAGMIQDDINNFPNEFGLKLVHPSHGGAAPPPPTPGSKRRKGFVGVMVR